MQNVTQPKTKTAFHSRKKINRQNKTFYANFYPFFFDSYFPEKISKDRHLTQLIVWARNKQNWISGQTNKQPYRQQHPGDILPGVRAAQGLLTAPDAWSEVFYQVRVRVHHLDDCLEHLRRFRRCLDDLLRLDLFVLLLHSRVCP